MAEKTFTSLIAEAKKRDSYWVGKAISDFTEDLFLLMTSRGVSKAELAKRIGSSPAYITKVLRGNTNFTLESMVRLVRALNGQLCVHVGRAEDHVRWFGLVGQHESGFNQLQQERFQWISESYFDRQAMLEVVANEIDTAAA